MVVGAKEEFILTWESIIKKKGTYSVINNQYRESRTDSFRGKKLASIVKRESFLQKKGTQ